MLFLCNVQLWPLYDFPGKWSNVPKHSSPVLTSLPLYTSNISKFVFKSYTIFDVTLLKICYCCKWCWICAMRTNIFNNSAIHINKTTWCAALYAWGKEAIVHVQHCAYGICAWTVLEEQQHCAFKNNNFDEMNVIVLRPLLLPAV